MSDKPSAEPILDGIIEVLTPYLGREHTKMDRTVKNCRTITIDCQEGPLIITVEGIEFKH